MSDKHIIDKLCKCVYCTMIDVIFGDPLLSDWEKKFIDSVARQGWEYDYSDKQKACLKKIYLKQRKKHLSPC